MDEKMTSGAKRIVKGNPATQSLKAAFKELIPDLPTHWKAKMYDILPELNTPKGATRLAKIRQGAVAPTVEELGIIRSIIVNQSK